MQVEIWSPDGQEAVARGDLFEVVQGENEPMLGLFTGDRGARVWLDEGDVEFLRYMLEKTEVGRA